MAQILFGVFFSLAAIGAVLAIAAMLRQEWTRVAAILSGTELAQAEACAPRIRVRQRAWGRPELRPMQQRHAAAA
jgi:hypothetical protein